jgi:hypothetical protein
LAAKHDQQANKFMYDRYNYTSQSYAELQKTDEKDSADVDKLMSKYYRENTNKLDEIQEKLKKWTHQSG